MFGYFIVNEKWILKCQENCLGNNFNLKTKDSAHSMLIADAGANIKGIIELGTWWYAQFGWCVDNWKIGSLYHKDSKRTHWTESRWRYCYFSAVERTLDSREVIYDLRRREYYDSNEWSHLSNNNDFIRIVWLSVKFK